MKTIHLLPLLIPLISGLWSCSTIPHGVVAVTPFNKEKYLGKWYEIARLDFKFERNLNNTTAEYSLNDDGSIKVDNRGYNTKKGKMVQAVGRLEMKMLQCSKFPFSDPFMPDTMSLHLMMNINMRLSREIV